MPTAAPSDAFEAALDLGTTGLVGTLGLRIIDNVGNTVEARSTADIIEDPAGSGLYQATRTAPATPGQYSLVWDDADTPTHYAIDELLVTTVVPGDEPGSPGFASGGPCTNWVTGEDVAACCGIETTDESIFDTAATTASAILFELSARQFPGICQRTVRPCHTACGCGWQMLSRGYVINWSGSDWACGEESPCGCRSLSTVELSGYPVRMILEVKIDGSVVSADTYRIDRKRYLRRVRDPAEPDTILMWPGCQDLDLEDDQDGTFSVSYLFGQDPPVEGQAAAAQLACEIYKQCAGDECQLPKGVTRINRQGITVEMPAFASWARADGGWKTGMTMVDAFLNAKNPAGLRRRPTVYAPSTTRRYAA